MDRFRDCCERIDAVPRLAGRTSTKMLMRTSDIVSILEVRQRLRELPRILHDIAAQVHLECAEQAFDIAVFPWSARTRMDQSDFAPAQYQLDQLGMEDLMVVGLDRGRLAELFYRCEHAAQESPGIKAIQVAQAHVQANNGVTSGKQWGHICNSDTASAVVEVLGKRQRDQVSHSDTGSTICRRYGRACVAMADLTPLCACALSSKLNGPCADFEP